MILLFSKKREDESMFKNYLIQRVGYLACQLSFLNLDERVWSLNKLWLSSLGVVFLFFSFCGFRFENGNLNSFVLAVGAGVEFLCQQWFEWQFSILRISCSRELSAFIEGTTGVNDETSLFSCGSSTRWSQEAWFYNLRKKNLGQPSVFDYLVLNVATATAINKYLSSPYLVFNRK